MGYLKRKAAAALNHGVGKFLINVSVSGLAVTVSSLQGGGTFVVDGTEQDVDVPNESKKARAIVSLVDSVIEVKVSEKQLVVQRWVEGDKMYLIMDCKGLSTTREFTNW